MEELLSLFWQLTVPVLLTVFTVPACVRTHCGILLKKMEGVGMHANVKKKKKKRKKQQLHFALEFRSVLCRATLKATFTTTEQSLPTDSRNRAWWVETQWPRCFRQIKKKKKKKKKKRITPPSFKKMNEEITWSRMTHYWTFHSSIPPRPSNVKELNGGLTA